MLQQADLPQFATAAAAAADLAELAVLALTDPGRVREWLKVELGVVKLGHRERILNALRRGPATALVAVDENDHGTSGAATGCRTGVFIGNPTVLRPLPALGEAGMHVGAWSLAEAEDGLGAGKCLLFSHASGTQVVVANRGGSVWVRRRGKHDAATTWGASQLLGRFAGGLQVNMASGAITPAPLPCADGFGRLESGARRPLGEGSFQWTDGRQILASTRGSLLGITDLPESTGGQYAAGPLVWLAPDGGLTLHDGRGRLLQLHVPVLDSAAAAHRRLAWAWVSGVLPTCIRTAVADGLGAAGISLASARVQQAEVALATSRMVQLAEDGCRASTGGDHAAALQYYLAAADWIQWMDGEATRRRAPTKLLLGVQEGLQRATVRAVASVAATAAAAAVPGAGPACEAARRSRRPRWVWPVPSHRLRQTLAASLAAAEAKQEDDVGTDESTICQRCFSEDAVGCSFNMRTCERLCAVCSGDKVALQAGSKSENAMLESVLAADSEQPSHFAMLSCYGGGLTGSTEPILINQWRGPGVCACCGCCGRLMVPRCGPLEAAAERANSCTTTPTDRRYVLPN